MERLINNIPSAGTDEESKVVHQLLFPFAKETMYNIKGTSQLGECLLFLSRAEGAIRFQFPCWLEQAPTNADPFELAKDLGLFNRAALSLHLRHFLFICERHWRDHRGTSAVLAAVAHSSDFLLPPQEWHE